MPDPDTSLLATWVSLRAESAQARAANNVYVLAVGEALGTSTTHGVGASEGTLQPPLPKSAGGGTSDGMDPWQTSVEGRLGRIEDKLDGQFKWSLGAFGGGFAFLLVAFATGFLVLSAKLDNGFDKIGSKIDTLAAQVAQSNERVARLEGAQDSKPAPVK